MIFRQLFDSVSGTYSYLLANHITGLGALRDRTNCITVMGENTKADVVSMRLAEGDKLIIEGMSMDVLYTPGHTDDSYSFLMRDRVFTGDTLFVRDAGRTDFQQGSPENMFDSVTRKLFSLPDSTQVFPAHDYKGQTSSTIAEEKAFNPKFGGGRTLAEFKEMMAQMKLGQPKKIDIAVPANMNCGGV